MYRRLVVLCLFVAVGPIAAQDMPLSQILIDGEGWKPIRGELKDIRGLAPGIVSGADGLARWTVDGVGKSVGERGSHGLTRGRDGALYVTQPGRKRIVRVERDEVKVIAEDVEAADLAVTKAGVIYASVPSMKQIVRIADGKMRVVAEGEAFHGLVLWSDGGTLVAGPVEGRALSAFRIDKDGSLSAKDAYYALQLTPGRKTIEVRGLALDSLGRVYAATSRGIQVFDPTGRLCGTLVPPTPQAPLAVGVCFNEPGGNFLVVAWGDTLYARKTSAKGSLASPK